MSDNLNLFYRDFLNAPETYEVRANGAPLEILDKLNPEEKKIAEKELIKKIKNDSWAIDGLVQLKSTDALVYLYSLLAELPEKYSYQKIEIAHAIYRICNDEKMIDVFLEEIPKQIYYALLGDALRKCSVFQDERINQILKEYSNHKDISVYLGARNALTIIEAKKK